MADYKLIGYGVVRLSDGVNIPSDPAIREWRRYLAWLADGNTPDPADPAPIPPAPEDTPLTPEDIERWMRTQGATPAVIAALKRDRGKPLP